MSTKKQNVMDKENYGKARLLESLNTLSVYIEDGEDKDNIDLLLSHIIQEIQEKGPFQKDDNIGKYCTFCGAVHNTHAVRFSRFHLNLITKIFNHVIQTGGHTFSKKDLDLNRSEYGNLYQLQRFGLIYFNTDENGKRVKNGEWGVPLKRVAGFLRGDVYVSEYYVRDKQFKRNTPSEAKIRVFDVPAGGNEFENEIPDFVTYDKL